VVGVHALFGVPTVAGFPSVVVVPAVDCGVDTGQTKIFPNVVDTGKGEFFLMN